MRRGKISNLGFILIFMVALSTIFSYGFDQLVIREEDKLRSLNIDYNNIKTEISSNESISNTLESIISSGNITVNNFLKRRHIWIKSLIVINDQTENKKFFKYPSNSEIDIKWKLLNNYGNIIIESILIAEKLSGVYCWNYKLFPQYLLVKKKGEEVCNDLEEMYFNLEKIFNEYIDEFYYKDYGLYKFDVDFNKSIDKSIDSFTLKNWLDVNRFTILLIKNLDKSIKQVRKDVDYMDELVVKNEETLLSKFKEKKDSFAKKNYYILLSIFFQILSLFFLLWLFRNFLKINK